MNEEKLNEVGALTEVETKDITKKKIRNKITLVYYYLIQLGFLAISGFIGFLFGLYKDTNSTYPFSGFDQSYIFGPIFVAIAHGGNLGLSYGLRKKDKLILKKGVNIKLSPFYVYPAVFLNFLLSVFFFLSIYHIMVSGNAFTATTRYGVYSRKKATCNNLASRSYHV
ncbi:MAG: hypothetical protein ACTSPF_02225 [Candidatus Heimdallarchaeaceae archaeon]